MEKLTLKDILPLNEYEKIRQEFKQYIIKLKTNRRIQVGKIITLVFENRESMKLQIQEMMRIEHIYDEDKIQNEIDIYNQLIPDQNELSATLLIEITEEAKIKPLLDKLMGLDDGKSLFLKIGARKLYAKFEEGHSNETKISAVHYVRFKFSSEMVEVWKQAKDEIYLEIEHPNYQAATRVIDTIREALAKDL